MAKFKVLVHATKAYSVEVEAEDAGQARKAAAQAIKDGKAGRPIGDTLFGFPSISKAAR